MLTDRVVPEPKNFKVGERNKVFEFAHIRDQVLAQIKLLQLLRVLEYFQRRDVVQ